MFKFYLYKFGQFCVNHLPVAVAYRWAQLISDMQYFFSPRDCRSVRNNLKLIVGPHPDLEKMTREVFRNFGRYLVEFFRMANVVDRAFMNEKVKLQNIDRIEKAMKEGKGVILLSGHLGNWELGGVLVSMMGLPVTAVALPHKERPVNDLFNLQREIRGIKIIPPQGAVKKCLEVLRNNQMIAIIADRDFRQTGEILDFFGKPTLFPKGPALLSEKTGAPIIPMFLIREGTRDNFILSAGEPIYPATVNDEAREKETMLALMRTYTKVIEDEVRKYPTQWLMFREFWVK